MSNILLVSHDLTVTGAPNSLLRQAIYLKEAGHNVEVWALGTGRLIKRYKENGFNPVILKGNIDSIRKYYDKNNKSYDLVICNTILSYPVVALMQYFKVPTVWFIRETLLVDKFMKKNPVFAEMFSKFYNLYTVSEYAAKCIRKYNPNVKVIPNAIFDTCADSKPIEKSSDTIDFGFIGTPNYVKGVDILVNAFLDLNLRYENINLYIAGGINNSAYIKDLLNKTKNHKNIVWLGKIQKEEKEDFFNKIDVLCVPSLDDPCPLTVIEGGMHSKVIIATENTGSNYIIEDGKSGFIVKTQNVKEFEMAMENVIKSDISEMKQLSRKKYLELGTTETEKKNILQMFNDSVVKQIVILDNIEVLIQKIRKIQKYNLLIVIISKLFPTKTLRQKFREHYCI